MNRVLVVADNILFRVASIYRWLENLYPLLSELSTSHTADKLFCLTREHTSAYYFYASFTTPFTIKIINRYHNCCKDKYFLGVKGYFLSLNSSIRYVKKANLFCPSVLLLYICKQQMGILYLVPTPVGNMEDMTLRAIRILKEADLVLCEDTRTSGILLKHFDIKNRLLSHHKFNEHSTSAGIVNRLKAGETIALISDAGTPGISDPGFYLAREAAANGITVQTLPGATAFVPALVSSGLPCDRFCFEGFLPQKKGRKTHLESLADETRTMIFYESPYRVVKTLSQFAEVFGTDRQVSCCREISKVHEESVRGTLAEVINHFEETEPRGEFVIVVAGKEKVKSSTKKARNNIKE